MARNPLTPSGAFAERLPFVRPTALFSVFFTPLELSWTFTQVGLMLGFSVSVNTAKTSTQMPSPFGKPHIYDGYANEIPCNKARQRVDFVCGPVYDKTINQHGKTGGKRNEIRRIFYLLDQRLY